MNGCVSVGTGCGNCVYATDYHPYYGDHPELWGTVECKSQHKRVVEALGCDKRPRSDKQQEGEIK